MSPELTFSRLTADDAQEAAVFLDRYRLPLRTNGRTNLHHGLLALAVRLPDSARHLVLACHLAGRLCNRALLHRSVSFQGRVWAAYLTTHLAIHPDLGRPLRAVASDRILDFSPLLTHTSAGSSTDARDVHVFLYEEAKRELIQSGPSSVGAGHRQSLWPFNQAIVNPVVLQRRVGAGQQAGRRVRPVVDADIPELASCTRGWRPNSRSLSRSSVDRLRRHILRLPGGRTYVVEDQGVPTAFITFCVMETLSASLREAAGRVHVGVAIECHSDREELGADFGSRAPQAAGLDPWRPVRRNPYSALGPFGKPRARRASPQHTTERADTSRGILDTATPVQRAASTTQNRLPSGSARMM